MNHKGLCCVFVVFQHVMRRSNLRIVRTTLNNVFACVCFRSAVCFAKQHVFFHVWVVHVGRQATHRVQPSPFHVGMRFSTFLLLFCLTFFLKEKKAQDILQRKVHGMRCCIKYCGATVLVRTSFFFLCRSLTADVCVCLGPVEAAPPSFAISFCVEK